MNQREALEQLEQFVAAFRVAVFTDDKTRLRSAFALRDEANLIDNGKSAYNVIVFGDLNRFKGLNDRYGHDAGDTAINQVGEKLHQLVAEKLNALAFRQGGDEFVILLPHAQLQYFISEASSFAEISFVYRKESLKTAMSFGYAVNDGKISFTDLLGRAEMACQYAKDAGDGSCVGWSGEIQLNPLVNRRGNCLNCGAKISCNVPQQNAPLKLKSCPCCGASL